MRRSGRVFLPEERVAFLNDLARLRQACVEVCRRAPPTGLDYRTASQVMGHLDDAVEALTGHKQTFWLKSHGTPQV